MLHEADARVHASAEPRTEPRTEPEGAKGDGGLDQSRLTCLVGYAASRAAITLKKSFARHLGPLELRALEFSILVMVASNGELNQKQLCEALEVSAPNMAVTLDRRAMHIHLTDPGHQLVQRAEAIARTMENPALRLLSPAERALLIELLMKVANTPL